MRRYQQFIAAGAEQSIFSGAGGRVIVLDPSSTVNVYIRDPDGNQEYKLVPGGVVKFELFDNLLTTHDGAGDTLVTLYIGGPEADAQVAQLAGAVSLIGGTVTTVGDIQKRSSANQQHFYKSLVDSGGANIRYLQLFNQVASGVTVYMHSLELMTRAAGGGALRVARYDTVFGGSLGGGDNKYAGGAAGVALFHGANNAALLGNQMILKYNVPQYEYVQMIKGSPIVLSEGEGVVVCCTTATESILAQFEFEEV